MIISLFSNKNTQTAEPTSACLGIEGAAASGTRTAGRQPAEPAQRGGSRRNPHSGAAIWENRIGLKNGQNRGWKNFVKNVIIKEKEMRRRDGNMIVSVPAGKGQTEIIQQAIDQCFLAGGGEVWLESGEHESGGVRLRSRVTLRLKKDALWRGVRDPEMYMGFLKDDIEPLTEMDVRPSNWIASGQRDSGYIAPITVAGSRWNNGLIRLIRAKDAAVIGEEGSVIDGCDPYDEKGEENYRGPHGISAYDCENLHFSGYTIQNTGNWAHAIHYSRNLVFENITAIAGHDGIHVTCCENVDIHDCEFYTGDDCVAGFSNLNVTVRRCEINTACSAFRFGGTNVYIEDCHLFGPARYVFRGSLTKEEKIAGAHPKKDEGGKHRFNMLSAFTYYSDFSVEVPNRPGNIVMRRCRIENADRFLHFNFSGNEPWQRNRPLTQIAFEEIDATGVSMPLTAYDDEKAPLDLRIADSRIEFDQGADVPLMHLANCSRVELKRLTIRRPGVSPWIRAWGDQVHVEISDVDCGEEQEISVTEADGPFVCRPI